MFYHTTKTLSPHNTNRKLERTATHRQRHVTETTTTTTTASPSPATVSREGGFRDNRRFRRDASVSPRGWKLSKEGERRWGCNAGFARRFSSRPPIRRTRPAAPRTTRRGAGCGGWRWTERKGEDAGSTRGSPLSGRVHCGGSRGAREEAGMKGKWEARRESVRDLLLGL